MGNIFDEIGDCYTCHDTGVILENNMVTEFCGDCEKGQHEFSLYAIWHNDNEMVGHA